MRITCRQILLCWLLLGIGWTLPASAQVLLTARSIGVAGLSLEKVTAHLSPAGDGVVSVQLHAGTVDVPAMGWRHVGLVLQGSLRRDERMRWMFDGDLRLTGAAGGALSDAHVTLLLSDAANTLLIDILQGKAKASAWMPLDQPSHVQISLKHFPVNWLQGLVGTVWTGRLGTGHLDADMALDVREVGLVSSGQFSLSDTGFDTPSGTLAAQTLSGSGRFTLDTTDRPVALDVDASLRGGELLLGPLYAKLPGHPVQLGLRAQLQHGAVAVTRLRVTDADALQLEGALAFDAKGKLQSLKLDHFEARFPAAYQRYGEAWLDTFGLRNVTARGQVSGSYDAGAEGLRRFAFDASDLDLADADGHLAVSGLHGGLDWSAQDDRPATTLGWRSLQFYKVVNGAAQSTWQSRRGTLSLQKPVQMGVLKGRLQIGKLDWSPAAAKGQRLATSLLLTGVDMSAFSQAMGWPAFPGTLAGAVPSLRWVDNSFELEGGLSAHVFGGFVDMTQLSLQQPFGPNPTLSADLNVQQLDLAAITSVFDFGTISGRLDGSVVGLQLANWSPVAFKASLLADGGGRISQRAVNNLTTVGGGGIAGGLQGAVLKLFKTFGYKRIGLNCTLRGSVCQMSGLEPLQDGYTIVEGSGLPNLQVIGHQTRVDWPTLVSRLHAAIEGKAPIVR
jgi:hypothetical protein